MQNDGLLPYLYMVTTQKIMTWTLPLVITLNKMIHWWNATKRRKVPSP